MPSLLPCLLFVASALAAPAQVERGVPACNADNCLRAFQNPAASASASAFCSAYLPASTATDPATITSTPIVTKTKTVPALTYTSTVTYYAPQEKFHRREIAPTTTSAETVQTAGLYSLLGCYREATRDGRALNGAGNQNVTSVEECAQFCTARGQNGPAKYMALEYFRECYCDDVFNDSAMKQVSLDPCSTVCDGDKNEYCGGDAFLDLYELATFQTATTTATTTTDAVLPVPVASSPPDVITTTTDSQSTTTTTNSSTMTTSETATSQSTTSESTVSQTVSSEITTSQSTTSETTTSQATTSDTTGSQSTTVPSTTGTSTTLLITTPPPSPTSTISAAGNPTATLKVPIAFTTQCVVGETVNVLRVSSACSCLIAPLLTSTVTITAKPKTSTIKYQPAPITVTITLSP